MAKASGEPYLFYMRAMNERVAETMALENKLRRAFENDEFVLHYQPKVDLETRSIVGVEALIRWQSPELGLVPPMKFIPLMDETGLILPVGAWALRRASLGHRSWVDQGLKAPRVAVNVSPIQLRQREFVGSVEQAIIEGVAPTRVSGVLCVRHTMSSDRRQYAQASQEDAEGQRRRAGGRVAQDIARVA